MSQAWGEPAFPVDTHIHRLACRWRLSDGRNVVQTERDLKAVFPREHWNALHLRIIYYGREHCTARGCDGHTCGICSTLNGSAAEKQRSPKRVTRVKGGRPAKPTEDVAADGSASPPEAGKVRRRQLKVVSPPESFLFLLSLSSFSPLIPDERER
jgi:hypothetical protein